MIKSLLFEFSSQRQCHLRDLNLNTCRFKEEAAFTFPFRHANIYGHYLIVAIVCDTLDKQLNHKFSLCLARKVLFLKAVKSLYYSGNVFVL